MPKSRARAILALMAALRRLGVRTVAVQAKPAKRRRRKREAGGAGR